MKIHRRLMPSPLRLLGASAAAFTLALAWALPASAATSAPTLTTCSGGALSGTYRNLVVTGPCAVPAGATVTINGTLTVTGKDAVFLSEFSAGAHVTINGNVIVNRGGLFAMGTLNEGSGCATDASSTVNGSVIAVRALSVKLDCTTVHGSLVSTGGGMGGFSEHCITAPATTDPEPPLNFVVKDNTIAGNVVLQGWTGCWMGVLRNDVDRNVILLANHPAEQDAMEVVTNTIGANLICLGNTPKPQAGDSHGGPNVVSGHELGQCATR